MCIYVYLCCLESESVCVDAQVKQKSRDKLLSEQQELAAVQEVVAQIQGAIADKQSQ